MANIGDSCTGRVKSYNPGKGYGFIVCDNIQSDLFFVHKNLPRDISRAIENGEMHIKDEEVAFTYEMTPEGKPMAGAIHLINGGLMKGGKGKGGKKGYESKGYESKGYESKGYGSKGYESKGYESKGYESKGYGGYNGSWDSWEEQPDSYQKGKGYGGYGGGKSKGNKGDGKGYGKPREERRSNPQQEEGTPMIDNQRIRGTIRSYRMESKWGFAVADPASGYTFGDIFVHLNNVTDEALVGGQHLKEQDVIEFRLEDLKGKIVAKDVTLVPQDVYAYDGHWMKGVVSSYDENAGCGFIHCPRVNGDIMFGQEDIPANTFGAWSMGASVLFKLTMAQNGPTGQNVNLFEGMDPNVARTRAKEVADALHAAGHLDEAAFNTIQQNEPEDLFAALPDLHFYQADNPSSFILGALTRMRKGRGKGGNDRNSWGQDSGKGKWDAWGADASWGYSKGGKGKDSGKGKGKRYAPY